MLQDEKEWTYKKISAVGRALGVFLMLSMQRPDAKVLDGKLKLNMTVRMGFRCVTALIARSWVHLGRTLSTIWSDDSKITWAQESASSLFRIKQSETND